MPTIHLIFNAHLDPIWLWPWSAGLDAALATCRSACDRLEAHPEITFARGEAWVYQQIEQVDPTLFDRIRGLVRAGRWALVGGWWIQPDCNLPSGWALRRQIELGRAYFLDRFGTFPEVAYNVDSFGHCAALPALLREAGQRFYVMMRPQEHEKALPARLFRWQGHEGGPEVLTFRIARAYTAGATVTLEHLQASLTELPQGIEHTMCFVGVGDHGGGPTERQIQWLTEHRDSIDGARIEFSTPARFFAAIADQAGRLPRVVGELQHHAIGCYSVDRPTKVRLRRAEHLLAQAERALALDPAPPADSAARLEEAWRQVCFHQFHDTLGGTCIPSAYAQVHGELDGAAAFAARTLHLSLRRRMQGLPADPLQRLVLYNPSDRPFAGYHECEPWLGWQRWQGAWHLLDEQGATVPAQVLAPEATTGGITRLLFRAELEPGAIRVLRIQTAAGAGVASGAAPVSGTAQHLGGDGGASLRLDPDREMVLPHVRGIDGRGIRVALPRLGLLDDPTDTWSHGIDRYGPRAGRPPRWSAPTLVDSGPLMASLSCAGRLAESTVSAEWRVYAGEPFVELRLRVNWCQRRQVLKLVVPLPAPLVARWDGIPGGELCRPPDGCERPLRDRTRLHLTDGRVLGIVCPDLFAIDAGKRRVRLTLLRSPLMAHHDPHPGAATAPRAVHSDRGEHAFCLRFFGSGATSTLLADHALMLQRPLLGADLTRGMPLWPDQEQPA